MSYYRPVESVEVNQVTKKSQFIGNLFRADSTAQAQQFVQQIKARHSSANHSCHCFIAGLPEQFSMWGYSDDGEPKGTAGSPMFQVLKHSGLGNTCVVVTRYFGGVKLGTGGIARAYSSTVTLAINSCITKEVHLTKNYSLSAPFKFTGDVEHAIKTCAGVYVTQRQWRENGLLLTVCIDDVAFSHFISSLSAYWHVLNITEVTTQPS